MAHTSPVYGIRIPDLTDSPNGPVQISNAVLDIEALFVTTASTFTSLNTTIGNLPKGKVAGSAIIASPTTVTTAETIGQEVCTGTVVSGRRYQGVHTRAEAVAGGSSILTARYRVANAGTVTTAGTLIESRTATPGGAFGTNVFLFEWVATFSGTATFGVGSLVNGAGTGPLSNAVLRIYDIGV